MSCCGNCTPEHLGTLGNDPYVTVPAPRRDTDTVQCHVTTLGNYGVGKSSLIYHTTTTTSPDTIRKKGRLCWPAAFRARHTRLVMTCFSCLRHRSGVRSSLSTGGCHPRHNDAVGYPRYVSPWRLVGAVDPRAPHSARANRANRSPRRHGALQFSHGCVLQGDRRCVGRVHKTCLHHGH